MVNLPLGLQPEYKLFEMNKRLSQRPDLETSGSEASALWWDEFVSEFFEDTSRLTIRNVVADESGQLRHYTISRPLIARFFRSFGEAGVTELAFQVAARCLTHVPKDVHVQAHSLLTLEADSCSMNTKHGRPMFAKICTEGQLCVEYVLTNPNHPANEQQQQMLHHPNPVRIRHFVFSIRRHVELIPRSLIAIQQEDPRLIEQLGKNITRSGMAPATLHFLRLSSVLEPMQELMVRSKATGVSPRECLRSTVIQKLGVMRMTAGGGGADGQAQTPSQPQPQSLGHFQRGNSVGGVVEDVKGEKMTPNQGSFIFFTLILFLLLPFHFFEFYTKKKILNFCHL